MRRLIVALWPMAAWMALVFVMSTDFASESHTGHILVPLLRFFDPGISPQAIERVHFLVRKAGHVTEYAILALLILRALRVLRATPVAHWSWSLALTALLASAAYGATDEFHQTFVPSRGPAVHDVVIDSCGAAVGLTLAFLWVRWRRSRHLAAG
jgi:VanZ family protein